MLGSFLPPAPMITPFQTNFNFFLYFCVGVREGTTYGAQWKFVVRLRFEPHLPFHYGVTCSIERCAIQIFLNFSLLGRSPMPPLVLNELAICGCWFVSLSTSPRRRCGVESQLGLSGLTDEDELGFSAPINTSLPKQQ
jgi:hypothetical protein